MAEFLKSVERIVVILAAVFALFPLYQWWAERHDRELARISNYITAYQTCDDWRQSRINTFLRDIDPNGPFIDSEGRVLATNQEAASAIVRIDRKDQIDSYCWLIQIENNQYLIDRGIPFTDWYNSDRPMRDSNNMRPRFSQ